MQLSDARLDLWRLENLVRHEVDEPEVTPANVGLPLFHKYNQITEEVTRSSPRLTGRFQGAQAERLAAVEEYRLALPEHVSKSSLRRLLSCIHDAVKLVRSEEARQSPNGAPARPCGDRVFIVHGHDHDRRDEVAAFVASLDLDPTVLDDRVSLGRTVVEKFESCAEVAYAIILMTPDDLGAAVAEVEAASASAGPHDALPGTLGVLRPRARQNVVFEMGYFFAKLGRGNVCVLVSDPTIEKPSDIDGLVYIAFTEEWKTILKREMHAVGVPINGRAK